MAKRGRPPQWRDAKVTNQQVREFAAALDKVKEEEAMLAAMSKAAVVDTMKAANFPVKPHSMAMQIRDVSDDPDDVALFVDQLNFCLEAMGVGNRRQLDIEKGDKAKVELTRVA